MEIKIAFPTDEHYPWQDERARHVALQIVQDFNPDVRICGSDGLDFYALSTFNKDPLRVKEANLQTEIDLWRASQREWKDAAPNADAVFIRGNHETRLTWYLWRHPEFAGIRVLEIGHLLGFEELGIELARKDEYQAGNLVITHGNGISKHSAMSAKTELEREFYSAHILRGHSHRGGSFYATTRKGLVQAHECFCLCSLEPEYLDNPNWQQGIALATVHSEAVSVELVPFQTGTKKVTGYWRGKKYTS